MRKRIFSIFFPCLVLLCTALLATSPAFAISLIDAVHAGLNNDPVLRAAEAQQRADAEAGPRAWADLLPNLSARASGSKNSTEETYESLKGRSVKQTYDSRSANLTLTQGLIRPRSWINLLQSKTLISSGAATFELERQQAIDRAVSAYTKKLNANAGVASAEARTAAAALRWRQAMAMISSGKANLVDVREAEATLAQEQAKVVEAQAALDAADSELTRLTGLTLLDGTSVTSPWTDVAKNVMEAIEKVQSRLESIDIEQHPAVMSHRLGLEAAQQEINKRLSDHAPIVDLVGNLSTGTSASDTTIGRESTTRYIGVQLNMPLYSGGLVSSSVREAEAMREKAEFELQNVRLMVANDRRRFASELKAGLGRVKAELGLEASAGLALKQVEKGLPLGLYSVVDLEEVRARKEERLAGVAMSTVSAISLFSQYMAAQGILDADILQEISDSLQK